MNSREEYGWGFRVSAISVIVISQMRRSSSSMKVSYILSMCFFMSSSSSMAGVPI